MFPPPKDGPVNLLTGHEALYLKIFEHFPSRLLVHQADTPANLVVGETFASLVIEGTEDAGLQFNVVHGASLVRRQAPSRVLSSKPK
jgi:hypothetical protein